MLYSVDDKSRAHWISTERVDENDGTVISSGASHADVEEVASFCETTECRRAYLATHFGHAAVVACKRNCNCGPMLEAPDHWTNDGDAAESAMGSHPANEENGDAEPSVYTVEYYYQKVLVEARRQNLPKREALLRRAIRVRQGLLGPDYFI
jgi:superfamily II DNA helicase RecQ